MNEITLMFSPCIYNSIIVLISVELFNSISHHEQLHRNIHFDNSPKRIFLSPSPLFYFMLSFLIYISIEKKKLPLLGIYLFFPDMVDLMRWVVCMFEEVNFE